MTRKCSISAPEEVWEIADSIATRLEMSRSEVIHHLVVYAGIVGGDFPLTREILSRPEKEKSALLAEVKRRAEDNDPAKPQSFMKAIREAAGRDDQAAQRKAVGNLIEDLLSPSGN